MFRSDHRTSVIDDDHRSANSTAIAGDIHCVVVVIDINAHKLTDPPSAPKTTEVVDKPSRKAGKTYDCPVYVDDKGVRTIDLRPGGLADV